MGREILDTTFLKEAGVVVEQHHERMDGSGYPFGLSGKNILTEAYIVAVADTFDAMTTDRPYRKALPDEVAFEEIRKHAGVHYPKEVVDAFFTAVEVLGEGGSSRLKPSHIMCNDGLEPSPSFLSTIPHTKHEPVT